MHAAHQASLNSVIEQNRFNMIEQQIRPCNVLNQAVLDTFYRVPRETFVPEHLQSLAFAETRLTLQNNNAKMLTPILEGKILQAVEIKKSDRILLVGTGSGYLAACMAYMANAVVTIDIDAALTQIAQKNTDLQKIQNIEFLKSSLDDYLNTHSNEKFDLIVLTGSVMSLPDILTNHLNDQGRIFAVVGKTPAMSACVFHYLSGTLQVDSLFETDLERLIGYEDKPTFEF